MSRRKEPFTSICISTKLFRGRMEEGKSGCLEEECLEDKCLEDRCLEEEYLKCLEDACFCGCAEEDIWSASRWEGG